MKSLATLTKGTLVIALAAVFVNAGYAQTQPKPATEATKAANRAMQQYLNFNDREDFDNATRGLIAKPDTLTIKDEKGNVVWDLEAYKAFISIDKPAPDTVNPSLWRNAQLNMQYGLFKVHDKIFQVRGYDLSNITFVQRRHRMDRFRSPDLGGNRKGRLRSCFTTPRTSCRSWPSSTAIRTSIITAACAASSMKPTSSPARCRSLRRNISPSTRSART